jgi:hypothetical protein
VKPDAHACLNLLRIFSTLLWQGPDLDTSFSTAEWWLVGPLMDGVLLAVQAGSAGSPLQQQQQQHHQQQQLLSLMFSLLKLWPFD